MTVLCDLDGVVYRGSRPLPGAGQALSRLADAGIATLFITNNSTRTPETTAERISSLTGVNVSPDAVMSSSLATVALLGPDDDPVFVLGEEGVYDAVARAGLQVTDSGDEARCVVVGLARSVTYGLLAEATRALRAGARFIATNNDPTFPTETGLDPGAGVLVAALETGSGRSPVIAGKPHRPMRELIRSKGVAGAWVVGDRLDTDMAMADCEEDWVSVMVLTGVTSASDVTGHRVDHLVDDLSAAVDLVLAGPERS